MTVTTQMKAIEQFFHVVLFIMLYKVLLTFKSVDETLVCNHSIESYWVILLCAKFFFWIYFVLALIVVESERRMMVYVESAQTCSKRGIVKVMKDLNRFSKAHIPVLQLSACENLALVASFGKTTV